LKSNGEQPIQRKDPFLVFKYTKPNNRHDLTIVQGRHKLIKDADSDQLLLYDLVEDIGESNDLAEEKPALTKQLYAQLTAYFKRLDWDESEIPTNNLTGRRN
jgi:hypothetical protein